MELYAFLVYILAYLGLFLASFYIISMFSKYNESKRAPRTDLKVSIIIPAYNEEKSIERTIASAVSLDYPAKNLEIIVVNDGSKDKTYELALAFVKELNRKNKLLPKLLVLTKKNGGKGSALNLGISKASGEIVITMDADTFANPDCLKKMMGYFHSKEVMAVSPSIGIYQPKSIWQRLQHVEYYLSSFVRKGFSLVNAVHVTPGAFGSYRKVFFEKYGGFDEHNLTEDIEIALRVQSKHYIIENAVDAAVYTLSPKTFRQFLAQRKRWYTGYATNLWNYKHLFTPKYGPLGVLILPAAVYMLVLSMVITNYSLFKAVSQIKEKILFLQSTGFEFNGFFDLNGYILQNFLYSIFTQPIFLFSFIFIGLIICYLNFSKRVMKYKESVFLNFFIFVLTYSLVYTLFWMVSFAYILTGRKVNWR